MSAQRGLADRKEYEAFCRSWYDAVLEETKRWCREEALQKLLAEAVMTDCRGQYADRVPPNNPEFNLRAQVCLIYSLTGENREKLEGYLALHRFREKGESQPPVPEEGKTIKDGDDSQRPDTEQSVTEAEEKPADAVAKPLPVPAAPVEQNSAQPKEKTDDASEDSEEPEKKKKRKLTDEEFWTIILTPELDGRAFRYLKSFLGMSIRLFKIKFVNCFVEGIRSDYESMGYGAALNGILKGFPYLRAWDFRMDWCHNRELHAQGEIHARTNLCRVFSLALAMFVYAGILFLLFWRRRSHVLKTGELPELGFIRKKIVGWMVEE